LLNKVITLPLISLVYFALFSFAITRKESRGSKKKETNAAQL